MSLNTKILTAGKYSVYIIALQKDEFGNQVKLMDVIQYAFGVEVVKTVNVNVVWLSNYWGNIEHEGTKIKEIKEIQ